MARPCEFNREVADAICERIAEGESLRSVCRDANMPNKATVFRWLATIPEFSDQYARARSEQAELYADDIVTIADEELDSQRARVRIDARKWVASKLLPKKYGEKSTVAHEGGESAVKIEALTPLEAARQVAFALALGQQALKQNSED